VVLDIVAHSLEACEEPIPGRSAQGLACLIGEGFLVQGLGGPSLRSDVLAPLEARLKRLRRQKWRVKKVAGHVIERADTIERLKSRIIRIGRATSTRTTR
jgi:hypothetical protein